MPYVVEHKHEVCDGCLSCVTACAEAHHGVSNCVILKAAKAFVYFSCMQCKRPQCAEACPTGAMRREADVVILEEERCVGCVNCVTACPWGAPKFNPHTGLVNKCDLCVDRIKKGEKPFCVSACPKEALVLKEVKPPPKKKKEVKAGGGAKPSK